LSPLEDLKKSVDENLLACGCAGEGRPFHPHLTIGRVAELNSADRRKIADALHNERHRDLGEWQIQRVDLMQSTTSSQGSVYTLLHSIPLSVEGAQGSGPAGLDR
jgi:RNA 2',3'-cyclic 3'-phosphodiesterase